MPGKKEDIITTERMFYGTSDDGIFQDALNEAVDNALRSSDVADDAVTWRLFEAKGRKGTIAGVNTLTVYILARLDSEGGK